MKLGGRISKIIVQEFDNICVIFYIRVKMELLVKDGDDISSLRLLREAVSETLIKGNR